jgi:hypothetical protein
MKFFGSLAALFVLTSLYAPAMGQQRLIATVEAQRQEHPSVAAAWIDGGMMDKDQAAGVAARGPDGKLVAARLDPVQGAYRVLWQVPAAQKGKAVGEPEKFTIELGTKAASPALAAKESNLIDDGDFERPEGQMHRPAKFSTQFRIGQEKGNHFLEFNSDPKGSGPNYSTPLLAVNGGENYTVSFRYRVTGGVPGLNYHLNFYSYIYFYGADKKGLTPSRLSTVVTNKDTDGWQTFKTAMPMPKGAKFTRLELRNDSRAPYSVAVDDLRIASAMGIQITRLTTAQGAEIQAGAQSPDIRRFDLGPDGSQVWPGFTALTPANKYDASRGFGFTRLSAPKTMDTVRPEALTRDFISAHDARLRVDLPKGQYQVWLITGDSQVGSTVERLYFDQLLGINGKEVFKSDETAAAFFSKGGQYWRFYNAFWKPGMDYYDTFIAPHFQTRSFSAEVADDHLEINWRNMPVDAILIAPADQAAAMQKELDALAGQRRRATQIEETPDPVEPMPKANDADQQRGYILFRRPANEIIYPSSRPRQGEEISELKAFAAPGQGQTVHFSLLPLKDLGALAVTAADLTSGSNTIPAAAVDVRVARYIFKDAGRSRQARADYQYQIAPFPLDHHSGVPGKAGVTWSWWATIRVPQKTPAGIYQGSLTIQPKNGQAFNLPLRLRVLPFELEPLPIVQGYYYFPSEPWYAAFWGANLSGPSLRNDPAIRKIIADNETAEMAFMKDLGLNSISFSDDLRGDVEYVDGQLRLKKDNRFAFWMDIYARAGMGPMPFYGFQPFGMSNRLGSWFPKDLKTPFTEKWDAAYRSFVTNVQKLAKERGWPEILWYISDEASNEGQKGAELSLKLAKLLEGMAGVRTIASMNGTWEHILPPHMTISMPNVAFPITQDTIKLIRDSGSKLWLYNCGDDRLMLGLYPWRVDAGGRFQWHYRYMVANPWDDLDGTSGDSTYSISLPGPDGPVPCFPAQTARAAINDHRYIATLERAIAAARDQPDKQKTIAQATQFLQDLRRRIPVDARVLIGYKVDPRASGAAVGGEFKNTDALDRVRWATAEYILQLSK